MSTLTGPQILGPGVLKFGKTGSEKEFQSRTTKTELKPELSLEDAVTMLDHSTFQPQGEWGGSIDGTFYQEYGVDSLLVWCLEHAGEKMPYTFTPTQGGITLTGECIISPVVIGGEGKKNNTADFSFKLLDKPSIQQPGRTQ